MFQEIKDLRTADELWKAGLLYIRTSVDSPYRHMCKYHSDPSAWHPTKSEVYPYLYQYAIYVED